MQSLNAVEVMTEEILLQFGSLIKFTYSISDLYHLLKVKENKMF